MDPITVVMVSTAILLLLRGSLYQIDLSQIGSFLIVRFVRAKSMFHSIGGVWFGLIGAPLAAWFLLTFWIAPLLNIPTNVNILSILQLSNPESTLIFLFLWLGIALAFFGGSEIYHRGKGK